MKRVSDKRRARNDECRAIRQSLIAKAKCCMICGHSPKNPWREFMPQMSKLCVHEVANGPLRVKALDKPFACLVLCWFCNSYRVTNKREWPEAKQLAVLLEKSPEDYDLAAYLKLTRPAAMSRITQEEVDLWLPKAA